jgi:sec-independent protein translocase protein TatB
MFDLGWPEMLLIAIVLIVVVGPKDLPKMLRAFGRTTSKMRSMAGEFRKQFDDAMKEAELDELKSLANDARKLNPASELKKAMSPMEKAARDVKSGLDSAMKPTGQAPAETASAEARATEPAKAGPAPTEGKPSARPLPEAVGAKRAQATAAAAQAKTKPAAGTTTASARAPAQAKAAPKTKSASRSGAKAGKAASAGASKGGKKS